MGTIKLAKLTGNSSSSSPLLIRCKAINQKEKQLFAQAYGLITTLWSLRCEEQGYPLNADVSLQDVFANIERIAKENGINDFQF